jgi:hypothetical protein
MAVPALPPPSPVRSVSRPPELNHITLTVEENIPMADTMRWRYGETNPVVIPVESATVVEIGDIVYVASDKVHPAAELADLATLALSQESLHDALAGVAMQRSRAGDTTPIRVATTGVFEFDCASATFDVGELVGAAAATGTNLENQKVVAVATSNLAIGRCAKGVSPAGTRVLVDIVSTLTRGGPQDAT